MRWLALVFCAAAATLALAGPAAAGAGRITVGLADGAASDDVRAAVEAATGGKAALDLGPLDALVFQVPDAAAATRAAVAVAGVEYAEPVTSERRLAYVPNDPLVPSQWYLTAIRAFDAWPAQPALPPVRVAIVDSGIDGGHPEFAGRIAAARSFVGTPPTEDTEGHGTVVAGEIAAALDNGEGIAGVGIPARLLVAKVVDAKGRISLVAEAQAIRWAVDAGAQVINLSLGGPRDPHDPFRDTYSALEHAAVDYATRRGVVVVAAAGNCSTFVCPERYASYPAALPHVLGVGAVAQDGSTPSFSNRDAVFIDVGAPGADIVSTFPRALSSTGCAPAGYTPCAADGSLRSPRGTSFSAPLATAAVAAVIGQRAALGLRRLHASQVTRLVVRSAADLGRRGRDSASGFGRLDVVRAVEAAARTAPARDRLEPNDDVGARSARLGGPRRTVVATLDRFDDPRDVYRVRLRRGQRLTVALAGPAGGQSNLLLWRPGTRGVAVGGARRADRLAASVRRGSRERVAYRAARAGWYYAEVRLVGGKSGEYRLTLRKD